jgi:hypothetical protein
MNYGHVIDPQQHFIYQVFEGGFSLAQLIACTRCLWNDPHYSKLHHGITDISRMTPLKGLDNLQALIAFLKSRPETSQGRWAVITTTPMVTAGAMLYQRAMLAQHPFDVFSTWESACDHLLLDMPSPPIPTYFPELAETFTPPIV